VVVWVTRSRGYPPVASKQLVHPTVTDRVFLGCLLNEGICENFCPGYNDMKPPGLSDTVVRAGCKDLPGTTKKDSDPGVSVWGGGLNSL